MSLLGIAVFVLLTWFLFSVLLVRLQPYVYRRGSWWWIPMTGPWWEGCEWSGGGWSGGARCHGSGFSGEDPSLGVHPATGEVKNVLSAADHARISEEIRSAERHTAGEIYVVLAHFTDEFWFVPAIWAAIVVFLLTLPLHLLTQIGSETILFGQVILFVVAVIALSHRALRRYLIPSPLLARAARKHARRQFLAHGVHLSQASPAVLIYVAVIDRRVEIVVDSGIHSKVEPIYWQDLADEVTSAARQGLLVIGILNAVAGVSMVLSRHFPSRAEGRTELPDHVVEV